MASLLAYVYLVYIPAGEIATAETYSSGEVSSMEKIILQG